MPKEFEPLNSSTTLLSFINYKNMLRLVLSPNLKIVKMSLGDVVANKKLQNLLYEKIVIKLYCLIDKTFCLFDL